MVKLSCLLISAMKMAAATISTRQNRTQRNTQYALRIVYSVFIFIMAACAPLVESTPFIPPAQEASPTPAATAISLWTATPGLQEETDQEPESTQEAPQPTASPSPGLVASETPDCSNDLKYLADLTVPDGSPASPGERIDKQWRVLNSGTCNWDANYRLKLVGGFPPLGAEINQALFPARAGVEATIQIFFSAPSNSGVYRSAWQAYDPQGNPFGETIYIEFVVP